MRRLIEVLHFSRRRQSRQSIRRYRHLLAEDFRNEPTSVFDFDNEKVGGKDDANRNQATLRASQ
jgi:hypothetical protein